MLWFSRIAFSAFFAAMTLLLLGLWSRSYKSSDDFWIPLPLSRDVGITSERGWVSVALFKPNMTRPYPLGWSSTEIDAIPPSSINFGIACTADYFLDAPIWFPVVVTTALAAAPLMPWIRRFGLRTLLIIATLFCVALGLFSCIGRYK
jgi:hypothetical protein